MNRIKKVLAVTLSAATIGSVAVVGSGMSAGASGTGAGLAEYALNAYYEGWSYVWGGAEPGAVDCSGLIWSYCGGDRTSMLSDAQANGRDWGYVSDGIPRVHGLGLSRPNHVGVYIEDGMEVDARGSDYGVCYQQIGENGWNNWDCWFKLTAVDYPTEGWENFNGNYYYYEDGEYIVDTSRTIDGTTYYFDSKGHSSTTPSGASTSSSSKSSSSSSQKSSSVRPTVWSKGSNDDEVVKIQTRLAELGYYNGAIDGDFGDLTDAAFRAFQAAAGLTVDGIAGSDREVLYSDNAPAAKAEKPAEEKTVTVDETPAAETPAAEAPAEETPAEETPAEEETAEGFVMLQDGDFSDQVATVQSKLAELGYFNLEATGLYGEITAEAVSAFQLANGLEATGAVDSVTYEMLFSDDAVAYQPAEAEIAEEPVAEETVTEEPVAVVEEVVTTEEVQAAEDALVSAFNSVSVVGATTPASDYTAAASKSVAKANEVTEKALEKSANIVPAAGTSQIKTTNNIWLWLVLAAVALGAVAFVLLMVSRKNARKASAKNVSVKARLNDRW